MITQLYPALAVLPGHPDRLCDIIADALVQEALRLDPQAVCRIDVAVQGSAVFVTGRLAGEQLASLDIDRVVQQQWQDHTGTSSAVRIPVCVKVGPMQEADRQARTHADCHALCPGYAIDLPGLDYLPAEHWLLDRLLRRLVQLRREEPALGLLAGGEVIVLLEEREYPQRLASCSMRLPLADNGSRAGLEKAVRRLLSDELAHLSRRSPGFDAQLPDALAIQAIRDLPISAGMSGRRLSQDLVGPRLTFPSALTGRDFSDPGRAGVILARRLARAVVSTGVARECHVMLGFVPGQTEAQVLRLFGDSSLLDASRWGGLLDRSLQGVAERYTGRVDLVDVACYGHFSPQDRPWERVHFDQEV